MKLRRIDWNSCEKLPDIFVGQAFGQNAHYKPGAVKVLLLRIPQETTKNRKYD